MTSESLVQFRWIVPDAGYVWVAGSETHFSKRRRETIALAPQSKPQKLRVLVRAVSTFGRNFDPFSVAPPISRTFAHLEQTEGAILDFANRYGALGTGELFSVPEAKAKGLQLSGIREGKIGSSRSSELVEGETLTQWLQEIAALRFAVELWDAIQESGGATLKKWVRLEKTGEHRAAIFEREFLGGLHGSVIFDTHRGLNPRVADLVGDGNLEGAARFLLQREINAKLEEHTSSTLLYSRERESFGVYSSPKNLLGALWLQLAKMVEGDREVRKCRECGTEFEVTSYRGGDAKRREYCKPACRVSAFGKRKARAVELHRAGAKLKAIAAELGSTVEIVDKWIAVARGEGRGRNREKRRVQ